MATAKQEAHRKRMSEIMKGRGLKKGEKISSNNSAPVTTKKVVDTGKTVLLIVGSIAAGAALFFVGKWMYKTFFFQSK